MALRLCKMVHKNMRYLALYLPSNGYVLLRRHGLFIVFIVMYDLLMLLSYNGNYSLIRMAAHACKISIICITSPLILTNNLFSERNVRLYTPKKK